jgi:putative transposase
MADVKVLPMLDDSAFLPKGAIIVLDRGYIDFAHFHRWCDKGIYFVTRAKANMAYEVVEERAVPAPVGRPVTTDREDIQPKSRVLSDRIIKLTGKQSIEKCPDNLRLVSYWDEQDKREFTFLTNNFKFSPITIAKIYKERWAIETFFKCLKQKMKVKSFMGTSFNAVKTQIWISLICLMLMMYLKYLSAKNWALSNFLAIVRLYLTSHVDLLALIENLETWRSPPLIGGPVPGRLF